MFNRTELLAFLKELAISVGVLVLIAGLLAIGSCERAMGQVPGAVVPVPADNPITKIGVDIGRELYFDPALSANGQVSCATCHNPDLNFTDGRPAAVGNFAKVGLRNTPTSRNSGYSEFQFHDGAAISLEAQASGPLENPIEMGDADNDGDADQTIAQVARRLQPKYGRFWPDGRFTETRLRHCLADYQRTLLSGPAAYDRWSAPEKGGTLTAPRGPVQALSASARRGARIFARNCTQCHIPPLFTDVQANPLPFHVTGTSSSGDDDNGRQGRSGDPNDFKKYKTPSLRDVARTAPYMHAGNFPTLESVVDFYNAGAGVAVRSDGATLRDGLLPQPGFLTSPQERADLVAFLHSLTTTGALNR